MGWRVIICTYARYKLARDGAITAVGMCATVCPYNVNMTYIIRQHNNVPIYYNVYRRRVIVWAEPFKRTFTYIMSCTPTKRARSLRRQQVGKP
jgi:hypothetical protein